MADREWKSGDVAMVAGADGSEVRAIRQLSQWATENGRYLNDWHVFARHLVVIDPEDREQVAALVELLVDNGWRCTSAHGLRDALREFANPTPPKPAEPGGRGAVVVDASGLEWVRVHPGGKAWVSGYETWANWSDIDVASVVRP